MNFLPRITANAIVLFARLFTGALARWKGCGPAATPRVYFANHSSHGDFVLIWGCLPPDLRTITRPVAGADYWNRSALRRFIGSRVFRALLIDRPDSSGSSGGTVMHDDPIALMSSAVQSGDSLIVFPEGTRNTTDERLLPFKSGIYRLACLNPGIEFIPVWIDNLNRVMPKGEIIPIPLLCRVTFGEPVCLASGEEKDVFLDRCRQHLLSLAPELESHS